MDPQPAREAFRSLLEQLEQVRRDLREAHEALQPALAERIRSYQPKWSAEQDDLEVCMRASKRLAPWEVDLLARPVTDAHHARLADLRIEASWLGQQLDVMARTLAPLAGETWLAYDRRSFYAYGSQTNARAYAQGIAELLALELEAHGVAVRIRPVADPSDAFVIEVQVAEPLDVELLRRAPSRLSFKEWLRAVLRKGLNPRVYLPGLRWGTEATLGLDQFGEDLPAFPPSMS